MNQIKQSNLNFLDGTRGIAMMIVVFHHFVYAFYPTINTMDGAQIHLGNGNLELFISNSPLNLFFNGGFAVSIFFVLSGFVLSYKFHQTTDFKLLTSYSIKRYFRLLIPVAGSILICYILHLSGVLYMNDVKAVTKSELWLGGIFNNMTEDGTSITRNIFYQVFFEYDKTYNPVLWTMTIEFLGSMMLFAFLGIVGSNKHWLLLHVVFALILLYLDQKFYASFILGSLIAKLFVIGYTLPSGIKGTLIKLSLLMIGIYLSSFPENIHIEQSIWAPINFEGTNCYQISHVIGAFILLFVICFDKYFIRFFSLKPFTYLGKISFAFYLLHLVIICSIGCGVFLHLYKHNSYTVSSLGAFGTSMAVTFLVSHFYYLWVDKTGTKLANKIGSFFKN